METSDLSILDNVKEPAMEKIVMKTNSERLGFSKGDSFTVKRTINDECVIIRTHLGMPNLIFTERQAKRYGVLTGTPQLCFG